jgi:hypothetical protein
MMVVSSIAHGGRCTTKGKDIPLAGGATAGSKKFAT